MFRKEVERGREEVGVQPWVEEAEARNLGFPFPRTLTDCKLFLIAARFLNGIRASAPIDM